MTKGVKINALPILVAAVLLAAWETGAQQLPISGGASGFNALEYFPAPHAQDIRRWLSGAEAQPLSPELLLVKKVKIEMFDLKGKLQLVAQAPECIYDRLNGVANSTGPVDMVTGDGQLRIDGEGFLWQPSASVLTISNQVQTVIAKPNALKP